ncbi:MAG: hypothetical protein V4722_18160 [Bacteroidota bacterium]
MKPGILLFSALITSFFFISSCTKDETTAPAKCLVAGDSVSITIKYRASTDFSNCSNGQYSLAFAKLISDSRCPDGGVCIWAGTAQIGIHLYNGTNVDTLELKKPLKLAINNEFFTFTLETLSPYPSLFAKFDISAYKATISIKK